MSKQRVTTKGPIGFVSIFHAETGEWWYEPDRLSLREHFGYETMLPHDRRVYEKAEAAMFRSWKRQTYRQAYREV